MATPTPRAGKTRKGQATVLTPKNRGEMIHRIWTTAYLQSLKGSDIERQMASILADGAVEKYERRFPLTA